MSKKIMVAVSTGVLGGPQNPPPAPGWNAQVAEQESARLANQASLMDQAERFDHAQYLSHQRAALESQRRERDLTKEENKKMQKIAHESKTLDPSTIKNLKAAASVCPLDPVEGLLAKPPKTAPKNPTNYVGPSIAPVIGQKLSDLVDSIDPTFKLTPEAEEVLLSLADQFVDSVVEDSCMLANHRVTQGGKAGVAPPSGGVNPLIDVSDVNLVLKEKWGISVPGLGKNNVNDTVIPMEQIGTIFRTGGVWGEGNEDKQQGGTGKGKK